MFLRGTFLDHSDKIRSDRAPPWKMESRWNVLLRQVLRFNRTLPDLLQRFTADSVRSYVDGQCSSQILHMQCARLLTLVLLHWECQFFPQTCKEAFERHGSISTAPPGFWRSSALECLTAGRLILKIVSVYRHHDFLPHTPFIAYAVYLAAFVDMYGHYVLTLTRMRGQDKENIALAKRFANTVFGDMGHAVTMVKEWSSSLELAWKHVDNLEDEQDSHEGGQEPNGLGAKRSERLGSGDFQGTFNAYLFFKETILETGFLERDSCGDSC